jgi:hypothetical protein
MIETTPSFGRFLVNIKSMKSGSSKFNFDIYLGKYDHGETSLKRVKVPL